MSRRRLLSSIAVVAVLAGACANAGAETTAVESAARATTTASVIRGDLSTEREFRATVSFGAEWTLNTAASGTITAQSPIGAIVEFGDPLLRIDDRPLFLAKGDLPMYRELTRVDTRSRDENGNRPALLQGFDVAQLQLFLIEADFDADGDLTVDGIFGKATEDAVKAWQGAVGLPVTGSVDNAQIVFAPEPVRIASASRVGAPFSGLQVNSAEPSILVDTSNRDRRALVEGTTVEVTLADGTTWEGEVSAQEQTPGSNDSTVWRTTISVSGELPGDASSATVTVTEILAEDALLVPVGALLALAEGGFAVEVEARADAGPGPSLVGVEVGEVLGGRAQISGDIAEGDQVVVAR